MLRRIAQAAATVVATGTVAATGYYTLVAEDQASYEAYELLQSAPRVGRFMGWALQTSVTALFLGTEESSAPQMSAFFTEAAKGLTDVCRQNGGVYIKAAQFATNLPAVPVEYREVLGSLVDDCQPVAFETVRHILERELRQPLSAVFQSFETEPQASASLAQVHRAVLHDGRQVAVKVQYPDVAAAVRADLRLLAAAASCATQLGAGDFTWFVTALCERLRNEVDFRVELRNGQAFADLPSSCAVAVPVPIPELSTSRVFVMEWVDGVKVTDVAGLRRLGIHPSDVGESLLCVFAEMVYVHGFMHGDLHAGNVLVRLKPQPMEAPARCAPDAPAAASNNNTPASVTVTAGEIARGYAERPRDSQSTGNCSTSCSSASSARALSPPKRTDPTRSRLPRWIASSPAFELVLLDHGHFVTLPDTLRRQYCQLWCAFVLHDLATADRVAVEMAGPRGSSLLPAIWAPRKGGGQAAQGGEAKGDDARRGAGESSGESSTKHGLQGLGALVSVVNELPPEIVEVLRMTQLVRHMTQHLGNGVADRLRVNAKFALRGLAVKAAAQQGALTKEESSAKWRDWHLSWQLTARVNLLRALLWSQSVVRYVLAYWYALYSSRPASSPSA